MLQWICGIIKRDCVRNVDIHERLEVHKLRREVCATLFKMVWTYTT
jgi:hypothetical protein